jgi:hypothetical protein
MTTEPPSLLFSLFPPTQNTNHYRKTRLALVATGLILNVIFLRPHMLLARHGQAGWLLYHTQMVSALGSSNSTAALRTISAI